MFEVSKIGKAQETKSKKSAKSTSGSNFADYLGNVDKPQTNTLSATSGVNIANAIFAAQTITTEEEQKRKKQSIKRGFSLIEKLEDIRDAILLNDFSKEKLIEISRFVKNAQESSQDGTLNEIIAEIELRVEVELAKLENLIEW